MLKNVQGLRAIATLFFARRVPSDRTLISERHSRVASGVGGRELVRSVQALRAIAALLVVLDHLNWVVIKIDPTNHSFLKPFEYFGQAGVDLFFVISGFIMVATNWNHFGSIRFGPSFLGKRFLRIFPPYWILILPIATAYFIAGRKFMHARGGNVDVVASILLFPTSQLHLLDISWTLTFEIFFYLIFSIIVVVQRRFLLPLLAIWTVSEVVAMMIWGNSANPWANFVGTPLPLEFIAGALIGNQYRSQRMPLALVIGSLGLLTASLVFFAVLIFQPDAKLTNLRLLTFGIPASLIIYGAVGLEMKKRFLAPRWLVEFGNSSYATYLWHSPVILLCAAIGARLNGRGVVIPTFVVIATFLLVYAVSTLAYRALEKPVISFLGNLITRNRSDRGLIANPVITEVKGPLNRDKSRIDFVS